MRIGFRTAGFHRWPIERTARVLGELGYDGVEICLEHPECRPEDLTAEGAQRLAALCAGCGLGLASVSYHADAEEPGLRRANTLRGLELCPAFGASVYIINGRRVDAAAPAEALTQLEGLLDQLLPRAAELGVVAIEPEPGLAIGSSAEMETLLGRRPTPNLGVNLDVGHAFLTDPDVCASIRRLGEAIAHTHLEGMPAGVHQHLLPGEGDLDLVAVCRALREIGYPGYHTIDLFNIAEDPVGAAKAALAGMRGIADQVR
jgi:sugar phosphate isomerase/epimerase